MAVPNFVTQFTYVYRHFEVYSKKQKKTFRKNCFLNEVSDFWKNCLWVQKNTLEKNAMPDNKKKPAAQAARADPSRWSSTNRQNPPLQ